MKISLEQTFVGDNGVRILCQTEVDDPTSIAFAGQAALQFPHPRTGQMTQSPFMFPIPGDTVHEAFANYQTALDGAMERAKADLQNQIDAENYKLMIAKDIPLMRNGHKRLIGT